MKAPKAPAPPPPAPDYEAAARERAAKEAAEKARQAEDAENRRLRGRAATLLTGGEGDTSEARLSSTRLLGS